MNEFDSLPLRDIHLPEAVSWWPPAVGWWLLLLILIVAIAIVWYWRRHRQINSTQQTALALLRDTRMSYYAHGDEYRLMEELSVLLRRISISVFPRQKVASLSGKAWLKFLDECMQQKGADPKTDFSLGVGRVFADVLYKKPEQIASTDPDAVCGLIEQWILCLPKDRNKVKR